MILKVKENKRLTGNVYKLILEGETVHRPGQFMNIKIRDNYLRRPISICDQEGCFTTLIYKTVGKGTEELSDYKEGELLDCLTGLGNGYDLSLSGNLPLLIGGGVGIPPLYFLAKELLKKGIKVKVILGFNTKSEVFYEEKFKMLGCETVVTTADGSYGLRGFVTDAFSYENSFIYACGPKPMLKAIHGKGMDYQFSFEERMGCGFGACMGCSIKTKLGYKRICKDGPVLRREEIIWED